MSFWVPLFVGAGTALLATLFIVRRIAHLPAYAQRIELTTDKVVFYIVACGFLAAVIGFWLGFLLLADDMYAPLTGIIGSVCGSLCSSIGLVASFAIRQHAAWQDELD